MLKNREDIFDEQEQKSEKKKRIIEKQSVSREMGNSFAREMIFDNYSVDNYLYHINQYGLENTWINILKYVKYEGCNDFLNPINFGSLYELGLAEQDKSDKKKSGQYYTPYDVSKLMAGWLQDLEGENICDIGCGTGNLIMAYLELLKKEEVISLLENRRIYLYDFDKVAIKIAQYSIALTYGLEYLDNINVIYGDFL